MADSNVYISLENQQRTVDKLRDEIKNAGGHTIVDENGISYPARANLKIENATIQDDSTNNTTIVTPDGGNDIGLYIDETTGLVYQRWEVN